MMSKATASGALGLAFASALGSFCCLPIATGGFGITLAALAAAVGPWSSVLASASLALLTVTVVQAVRRGGSQTSARCDTRNRGRGQWLFVGMVGLLTLALLALPR